MMGGMGGMGQGMGGNQPPAGPQSPPKIKRDRETQAVLDGTTARDEALIASILSDTDLITSGTDDDSTDPLLDGPRNAPREDHPTAPELPQREGVFILRDDDPSDAPGSPRRAGQERALVTP